MPNGKTHAAATVLAAGVIGPLAYSIGAVPVPAAIALSVGTMLGLLVTPDLDVRIGSRSFWLVRQSFGPFIGYVWQWLWQPYAHMIPRHRHPLSHLPILGTALRLLYMFLGFGAVYWIFRTLWISSTGMMMNIGVPLAGNFGEAFPTPPGLGDLFTWPYFWWAAAGLACSDALHTLMDYTWPWQ